MALIYTIKYMGNPFVKAGPELLVLDSHDVMPETVVQTVRAIEVTGKVQYIAYKASVLEKGTKSIHEPIKKTALPLFRRSVARQKQPTKTGELKDDVSLLSPSLLLLIREKPTLTTFSGVKIIRIHHPFPIEEIFVQEKE